jgi:hypothetical protein
MKKLILALLFVIVSLTSKAQNIMNTYGIQVGYWNYIAEDWDYKPLEPCVVSFILQGNVIIANDLAASTYYTYELFVETDTRISWRALDEKQLECIVSLVSMNDIRCFVVMYNDIIYRYYW